ncbi:MAG: hypothetical protein Q7T82_13020 [Armatimonadota bacterium]|nr:hypothetical protein [Armatimonadota bacterium]
MLPFFLIILLITALLFAAVGGAEAGVVWQIRDMYFCRGDLFRSVKYKGPVSVVDVPADGKVHELMHGLRFMDLEKDEFLIEFGKVSEGVTWELGASPLDNRKDWLSLLKGKGGGKHKIKLSKIGLPKWAQIDMVLRVRAEKPESTMEILRWAVLTSKPVRFAKDHEQARQQLKKATPLERGITPHWNPKIGGFVCACNYTHPEHYNYWLEDNGEQLWSFGNYPMMMNLYGKGLRDLIVDHCRHGAPVRRVNDQPLSANPYLKNGQFHFDTGLLDVNGNLSENPHVDLHHSVYEAHGLLASLGGFFASYKGADGAGELLLAKPSRFGADYNTPADNNTRLTLEGEDSAVKATFTIDIFRARATVEAKVSNKGRLKVSDIEAGFVLRECERYYKKPLNSVKEFGDVAILYSEQPKLEDCNIVRLAGPAVKGLEITRKDGNIQSASVSAGLKTELVPGAETSMKLCDVNAGSTSFAPKIDNYKDVDFEDADISLSYVGTYALLGLATYSYRFPEDKEARDTVDTMIDNFLAARDRARDRELGYLLWVLSLYGRGKDAAEIARLLEQRTEGKKFNSLDGSAVCMGLRSVGRWDLADKIGNEIDPLWEEGVAPPTDLVGLAAMQSPATAERAYLQLSRSLWMVYWDTPEGVTTHNNRSVEEGPQETNCYLLVALDEMSRLYGGIVPIRLNWFKRSLITGMSFDAATGEWRLAMTDSDEVDIFTHFRKPNRILWNRQALAKSKWRYSSETGVIYITGLEGKGELSLTVDGDPPKDDPSWPPIDFLGLKMR